MIGATCSGAMTQRYLLRKARLRTIAIHCVRISNFARQVADHIFAAMLIAKNIIDHNLTAYRAHVTDHA